MQPCSIYVSVPVTCFRVPHAREYFETYPCPPPSTVYGMLLSAVGEKNRLHHEGAEIAIALLSEPEYSTVLRTMWRVKEKNAGLGLKTNRRPDFQELLTDMKIVVWIRKGEKEQSELSLAARMSEAIEHPESVQRFGGLSLGESTHLVDELGPLKGGYSQARLLVKSEQGEISFPIWPDHVGARTRWGQFSFIEWQLAEALPDNAWIEIRRPS